MPPLCIRLDKVLFPVYVHPITSSRAVFPGPFFWETLYMKQSHGVLERNRRVLILGWQAPLFLFRALFSATKMCA